LVTLNLIFEYFPKTL